MTTCSAVRGNGFTLIEVAVVLAIIGMLTLLVVPRLPAGDRENLRSSARTLAGTLRYAQERAAATRSTYYLNLAPGEGATLSERGADGSPRTPADPLLQKPLLKPDIRLADVTVPRLGKVTDGQLRLDIGMGGLREFVVMHLRNPAGEFWTVMAFPAGGKVKLLEGYQDDPL